MELSHSVCALTPLGDTASCSVVSATHVSKTSICRLRVVCAQVDALLTGPSPPHEGKHLGKRSCTTKQTSSFPTGGATDEIMLLGECSICTCIMLIYCPCMRDVCPAPANGPPLPH